MLIIETLISTYWNFRFKEATLQTCYNHLLHRCHELLETATRGAVRFPRLVKAILVALITRTVLGSSS